MLALLQRNALIVQLQFEMTFEWLEATSEQQGWVCEWLQWVYFHSDIMDATASPKACSNRPQCKNRNHKTTATLANYSCVWLHPNHSPRHAKLKDGSNHVDSDGVDLTAHAFLPVSHLRNNEVLAAFMIWKGQQRCDRCASLTRENVNRFSPCDTLHEETAFDPFVLERSFRQQTAVWACVPGFLPQR